MRLISGYDTKYDYYVTGDGHVFVDKWGELRELQQESSIKGYYRVMLANKPRLIHRLVATAYLDPIAGCNVVNHLDEDKTNNHYTNLEWTTQSGNMKHYFKTRQAQHSGHENCNAKLTPDDVIEILRLLGEGQAATKIAKVFGVGHTTIYNIKLGKSYTAARRAAGLEGEG